MIVTCRHAVFSGQSVTLIILTQTENGISYGFYTRGKFCAEDKLIKTMGWIFGIIYTNTCW